tara:strand:+ start:53119 stop:53466 length:348 start_codon:yes stop_codon:yes gene_type:complete
MRVKVLNTSYNKKNNLVKWHIKEVESDKETTLAWDGNDLGTALGIKKVIPPTAMKEFCNQMVGKEINLVMKAEHFGVSAATIGESSDDQLEDFDKRFSPYQKIMGDILEDEPGPN